MEGVEGHQGEHEAGHHLLNVGPTRGCMVMASSFIDFQYFHTYMNAYMILPHDPDIRMHVVVVHTRTFLPSSPPSPQAYWTSNAPPGHVF